MSRRSFAPTLLGLSILVIPGALAAQSMREAFDRLFVFGEGQEQLFLAGSAGEATTQAHGAHFLPDQSSTNGALLGFFTSAVASNVSSFPLPSTVSSQTFRFVDGVPTPTSTSFGPILAERAQTIGRGRLNAGVNYSFLGFDKIRGVPLSNIGMTFVHINADFEGCDEAFGGDCTDFGNPQIENDLIDLDLDIALDAALLAFYATYGFTDWLDLSVAVPVIDLSLRGSATAVVRPSTDGDAFHFFGGTPQAPVLAASSRVDESTAGIGDIAVRLKARITPERQWSFALLGEARVPTGREEDFLGTGSWNLRGVGILSGDFSQFSPHANLSFEYRGSDIEQNRVGMIAGFDYLLAGWVTMAVDLLGSFGVGADQLEFPEPVQFDAPFRRTVDRTNIPDRKDDIVDGAFGFKFRTGGGIVIIANALIALNDGGLRSGISPTVGVEYLF